MVPGFLDHQAGDGGGAFVRQIPVQLAVEVAHRHGAVHQIGTIGAAAHIGPVSSADARRECRRKSRRICLPASPGPAARHIRPPPGRNGCGARGRRPAVLPGWWCRAQTRAASPVRRYRWRPDRPCVPPAPAPDAWCAARRRCSPARPATAARGYAGVAITASSNVLRRQIGVHADHVGAMQHHIADRAVRADRECRRSCRDARARRCLPGDAARPRRGFRHGRPRRFPSARARRRTATARATPAIAPPPRWAPAPPPSGAAARATHSAKRSVRAMASVLGSTSAKTRITTVITRGGDGHGARAQPRLQQRGRQRRGQDVDEGVAQQQRRRSAARGSPPAG